MRPRSLWARLAWVLFGLLLLLGAGMVTIVTATARRYGQEVQQTLQRDLAAHLVEERLLMNPEGEVRREAMEDVFHDLMIVNPAIEVYLLDAEGRILEHAAPPGRVRRDRIDLAPVGALLEGERSLPVLGTDPRGERGRNIFSVAPVEVEGETAGYLYIVLAGEAYTSTLARVAGSQILKTGVIAVGGAVAVALLVGLSLFWLLTRRLRSLTREVRRFAKEDPPRIPAPTRADARSDEITRLRQAFHEMAARIVRQIDDLQGLDALRRELVANVSHDLRTPLAQIQGYVETVMLREEILPAPERREYLAVALRQCERLNALVSDLFDLARLEARAMDLDKERFSTAELLQDVVQEFRLRAEERRIRLSARLDAGSPFVEADLRLVERVFENLLENALHHTPEGGAVELSVIDENGGIRVDVADTGEGIEPHQLRHIFDRYYRVRRGGDERVGGGLGLAIAKRIVELHGGTIDCRSEPRKGTVFSVVLPREVREDSVNLS